MNLNAILLSIWLYKEGSDRICKLTFGSYHYYIKSSSAILLGIETVGLSRKINIKIHGLHRLIHAIHWLVNFTMKAYH